MEVGKGGGERRAWRRTHFIISTIIIIIIMIISIMIIIISIIMVMITVTILVRACTGRLPWANGFFALHLLPCRRSGVGRHLLRFRSGAVGDSASSAWYSAAGKSLS